MNQAQTQGPIRRRSSSRSLAALALTFLCASAGSAQAADAERPGYTDSPMQPNGKWHIHDSNRPYPAVVTPGKKAGDAPSDAIVLMGGPKDIGKWQHKDGTAASWKWRGGAWESGKGWVVTKENFKDFQLHVEWAAPSKVQGEGQGRGNSGIFLLGNFEIQVLDSYNNVTYADGQASAMYGQHPPFVNACRKPGAWQTYDIIFTAPVFKGEKLEKPAIVTVLHNGVVTQNATAYLGPTTHKQILPYTKDTVEGPIGLQDHGNPVRFRNIWVRPLKGHDQP